MTEILKIIADARAKHDQRFGALDADIQQLEDRLKKPLSDRTKIRVLRNLADRLEERELCKGGLDAASPDDGALR